jgi:septal ring factor EnvC (AmiA/AmiB activator)
LGVELKTSEVELKALEVDLETLDDQLKASEVDLKALDDQLETLRGPGDRDRGLGFSSANVS